MFQCDVELRLFDDLGKHELVRTRRRKESWLTCAHANTWALGVKRPSVAEGYNGMVTALRGKENESRGLCGLLMDHETVLSDWL